MQQMHGPDMGAGNVLMYVPVQRKPKTYVGYKDSSSIVLGIAQIIIGVLCIIFNSVCLGVHYYGDNNLGVVGHGYWCGIMFIITGALGIAAGKQKTACTIVAFMVLCIISSAFTIGLLTVGIIGACIVDRYECNYGYNYGYYYDYYNYYPYYNPPCYKVDGYEVLVAMESMMAILAFIEAVVAIVGSALCCKSGVCCCSQSQPTVAPTFAYPPCNYPAPQINQTQAGQFVFVPQMMLGYQQGLYAPPAYCMNPIQPLGSATAAAAPPADASAPPRYQSEASLRQSQDEKL